MLKLLISLISFNFSFTITSYLPSIQITHFNSSTSPYLYIRQISKDKVFLSNIDESAIIEARSGEFEHKYDIPNQQFGGTVHPRLILNEDLEPSKIIYKNKNEEKLHVGEFKSDNTFELICNISFSQNIYDIVQENEDYFILSSYIDNDPNSNTLHENPFTISRYAISTCDSSTSQQFYNFSSMNPAFSSTGELYLISNDPRDIPTSGMFYVHLKDTENYQNYDSQKILCNCWDISFYRVVPLANNNFITCFYSIYHSEENVRNSVFCFGDYFHIPLTNETSVLSSSKIMLDQCEEITMESFNLQAISRYYAIVSCYGKGKLRMRIFDYQLKENGDAIEIKEENTSTQPFILLDFTILSEFELYVVGVKEENTNEYSYWYSSYKLVHCGNERTDELSFIKETNKDIIFSEFFEAASLNSSLTIMSLYSNNTSTNNLLGLQENQEIQISQLSINTGDKDNSEYKIEYIVYNDQYFKDEKVHSPYCTILIIICNKACKTCSGKGNEETTNCDECDNQNGYYGIKGDTTSKNCYHKDDPPENYFFNNEKKYFEECYNLCKKCKEKGNESDHKCKECINGYRRTGDGDGETFNCKVDDGCSDPCDSCEFNNNSNGTTQVCTSCLHQLKLNDRGNCVEYTFYDFTKICFGDDSSCKIDIIEDCEPNKAFENPNKKNLYVNDELSENIYSFNYQLTTYGTTKTVQYYYKAIDNTLISSRKVITIIICKENCECSNEYNLCEKCRSGYYKIEETNECTDTCPEEYYSIKEYNKCLKYKCDDYTETFREINNEYKIDLNNIFMHSNQFELDKYVISENANEKIIYLSNYDLKKIIFNPNEYGKIYKFKYHTENSKNEITTYPGEITLIVCKENCECSNENNLCEECKDEYFYQIIDENNKLNCVSECNNEYKYYSENPKRCHKDCNKDNKLIYKNSMCVDECPEEYSPLKGRCIITPLTNDPIDNNVNVNLTKEYINATIDEDILDYYVVDNNIKGTDFDFVVYDTDNIPNERDDLSSINLTQCIDTLKEKEKEKINENDKLIIAKIDIKNENSNSKQVEYYIYDKEGNKLNMEYCKDINTEISIPIDFSNINLSKEQIYLLQNNINIFNKDSTFFTDECQPFVLKKRDVIMKDRLNKFLKQESFCEENCIFKDFNYEKKKAICSCLTKSNFDVKATSFIPNYNLTIIKKYPNLNFFVIKCYKQTFFVKKGWYKNIGFYFSITIIISISISFIKLILTDYVKLLSELNIGFQIEQTKPNPPRIRKKGVVYYNHKDIYVNLFFQEKKERTRVNYASFKEHSYFHKALNFNNFLCEIIKEKNIFSRIFPFNSQYELLSINLIIFILFTSIIFSINAMFYTTFQISKLFYHISYKFIVINSLICIVICYFFDKYIYLSLKSYYKLEIILRESIDQQDFWRLSKKYISSLKRNNCLFFIFQLIITFFNLVYLSCFCWVFKGTQIILFINGLISLLLYLLFNLIICLILGYIKYKSIKNGHERMYNVSNYLLNVF